MLLTLLIPALGAAAPAASDSMVPIKEWTVPWEKSRPRDPAVAPDGKIFFVGQVGNYVARLDPATGEFKKFEIDAGTHPHNLVVDPKGIVWYAGNANGTIGRLDPGTGKVTVYPMPRSRGSRPPYPDFRSRREPVVYRSDQQFRRAPEHRNREDPSDQDDDTPRQALRHCARMRVDARISISSGPTRSAPSIRRPWSFGSTSSPPSGLGPAGSPGPPMAISGTATIPAATSEGSIPRLARPRNGRIPVDPPPFPMR